MRTLKTKPIAWLSAIAVGFALITGTAFAQDHVIAIGQVNADGTLANSANTVGGVVASVSNVGDGDYTVTVTAAGAFAGTTVADFVAEVTCENSATDDQVPKIRVSAVTADELTLLVHTADAENAVDTDLAFPTDNAFFFSVYRVPASFATPGASQYLLAAGKVSAAGVRLGSVSVDGAAVGSIRNGMGSYTVSLAKAGAYAGAVADDFVLLLSLDGSGVQDDGIRGEVATVTPDAVTVNVFTDDVQDEVADNSPVPEDNIFHFTIYRINPAPGQALANLLAALGRVASDGTMGKGGVFGGGTVGSVQNSTGNYTVTITSAGAFAGRVDDQYVLQVFLDQIGSADEVIEGDVKIVDANTMTLDVATNDGEMAGQDEGEPFNAAFHFLIIDTLLSYRPDLRIGKPEDLTLHKGNGTYNAGAASQEQNVKLRKTRKKKYYISLENDGNHIDDISFRGKRSGNKIKAKYFRITDGRVNVTAAFTSASGMVMSNMLPGKIINFQAQARYKKRSKRPKKTLRFVATSNKGVTPLDANKAKVIPK